MPRFVPGTPIDTGDVNNVLVEMDPAAPLRTGRHQFRLVVVDDAGNESEPAFADVVVLDQQRPTAVITPPRQTVAFGQNFSLSGAQSSDIGGRIVRYVWTLIE